MILFTKVKEYNPVAKHKTRHKYCRHISPLDMLKHLRIKMIIYKEHIAGCTIVVIICKYKTVKYKLFNYIPIQLYYI